MRNVLCHLQRNLYKLFQAKVIERSQSDSFCDLYKCGVTSVQSANLSNVVVSLNKNHQSYNLLRFSVPYHHKEMAKRDLNFIQHSIKEGVFGELNSDNLEQCTSTDIHVNEERCKSDVDSFGLDMLFDMDKVVQKVKVELTEKRKKRKMQQKVCHSNEQKNKGKKWKEENNSDQSFIKDSKSDSDSSFGLTTLFDQKKTAHLKRKTKKAKKIGKRVPEEDSYGLEMLFSEKNISGKKSKQRRRERKMVNYDLSETVFEEDKEQEVIIKVKKKRPNHFVAIRVSDSKIHLAIKDFQGAVVKENVKLKPALIPLTSLHITMAVMHLEEAQVNIAQDALEKSKDKIIEALKPVNFQLTFSGVGNFNNEVVFAKIGENEQSECLKTINHVIRTAFEKDGICLSDKKEWKPHLTLLKLSRKRSLRKSGIKKVEEEVYASLIESYFGEELVQNVHLCSMLGSKGDDGFYKCLSTISFPNDSDMYEDEANDETMLLDDED